ncbi:tetratricopeptide repeat protein [Alicyclobacillus ferrooxydans]|uniref:Tetratricopeptide repeat protein n=1 Tax=Alicyclobacillus ferrooxydans TaxID=471514 RepID=A0A0P9EN58_9BACL|nr:tetratricopeptide repeat protein [Alicyclobacillus ferrooxydans]KPV44859.1 hypothetical protein AN477_05075 [Alicyclobacillus ferrooxydans]
MPRERWLKTAYAYLYIRDFDAARRAFEQAIAEDPDNPETYFHASVTALRNGEIAYAEEAAAKAAELAPDNSLYVAHLGAVRAEVLVLKAEKALGEGLILESKQLLEDALTADPLCERAYELQQALEQSG